MGTGSQIVAAMDADVAGRAFCDLAEQAVVRTARPDLSFRVHLPERAGDDWNEVLKGRHHSFPIARL